MARDAAKNGKKTELKCNKVAKGVTREGASGVVGGRCHRAEAVAHFSFVVGSCSFRFFIERKRERVRERARGRHFRQIYSRAGRLFC